MIFLAHQTEASLANNRGLKQLDIGRWVYLGTDSMWRRKMERHWSDSFKRIRLPDMLSETAWHLRQHYIDWIGELSLSNQSVEWWASNLAGKNPYYYFFFRICLLAAAMEIIRQQWIENLLFVSDSEAMLSELKSYVDQQGLKVRRIARRSEIARLRERIWNTGSGLKRRFSKFKGSATGSRGSGEENWIQQRRRFLDEADVDPDVDFKGDKTVLCFTWIDYRSFDEVGRYVDPHLGGLPDMIQSKGYRVAFVPRFLDTLPFPEAVEKLQQTRATFIYPERYISNEEWIACLERSRTFHPDIPTDSRIDTVPVKRLAMEHLTSGRKKLAKALLYDVMIRNMKRCGICPELIVHTCEGHNWEQVMTWSVRRHMPKTKVIAYENVVFTRMLLSMYPAKSEFDIRPLPDRIVTNGHFYQDVLIQEGWPPNKIRIGGALRHNYLWEEKRTRSNIRRKLSSKLPVRVLVATPIGFSDSVELVEITCQAFGGDRRFEVIVKCHPAVDSGKVKAELPTTATYKNIVFRKTDIKDLLPTVDILLYSYTSVCFEALQHGVLPINIKTESFLNLDQLDAVPEIRWQASTAKQIQDIVEGSLLISDDKWHSWHQRAVRVVKQAMAPVTHETVDAFLI